MQTYAFYTKKGERLGIFLDKQNNRSVIQVYRCSLEDQFSKKEATYAHLTGDEKYHPDVICFDTLLTGSQFFAWCKENYWQLREKDKPARYKFLTKIGSKERILDIKPLFKMNR